MSLTLILIIITSAISIYAWQNHNLLNKWILHPYSVYTKNTWFQFLTSGFLHADWTHLLFNMFSFFFFGSVVEVVLISEYGYTTGILLFLAFYLGGIIVSDIPTYLKHKHNPAYRALGASGGVAAIIFSSILFYPINDICLYGLLCVPGFILGILYLIYSYYQSKRMSDNINHDAHFYGAVYGVVLTLILVPSAGPQFIEQISGWSIF
ncbi:MAG: rhomboid family intramembrane serine protease [Hymenobacteraceae bacterium]|nr:rhomboid family intramembrane serine protease [Hymenobacteraceae bacterium]MDX5395046.1 rhomboid family intramembrane serine protease [Hymenobacteraceae bacterium]MDX5442384.1 rhomboid family intramembrane serine protease [Hymenobacteraceae bacterium]MDX5511082.1 rhomboid family intramembrane serine protease [Hymenobacteraceae bacterium]